MLGSVRKSLPYWLKMVFRFLMYVDERRRFFRELNIKKEQDFSLTKYNRNTENLILFFVPGADKKTGRETISGGVISLVSLCEETAKLSTLHHSTTLMCTFPREFLLFKHINFENTTIIYRFEQICAYFSNINKIVIHLPELFVEHFKASLFRAEERWLNEIKLIHINIINANILLMPPPEIIQKVARLATKTTITAAHTKYCTLYHRNLYGFPLHKFSAWISPEQYFFRPFDAKEDLIVVSPDDNPHRDEILKVLTANKTLQIVVLQNMTHTAFKEVISRAKWALTFGEGLDGYILEPIFSGAFGFAVYNDDFFTEDFENLKGIFSSYREMEEKLMDMIQQLDNPEKYTILQQKQFELCAKYYSYSRYQDNIRQFYLENYTYK